VNWFTAEISKRGLGSQRAVRPQAVDWNAFLAERARKFHQISSGAVTGVWKTRSANFWGGCHETPTLRQLNLTKGKPVVFTDFLDYAQKRQILIANLADQTTRHDVNITSTGGTTDFTQWSVDEHHQLVETP